MEIQDKVAIVSGASTGIGWATARLFAQRGARVALVARSADLLQQLESELPGSRAFPADLSVIEAIPGLVDAIEKHFGRVDVLINNAGRAFHTPIEHTDVQLYRRLLDLNVVSVLRLMQCVIPILRRQGGGAIVNISSGLSRRTIPGTGPYTSTKFALNALSLIARTELANDHITVGLIYPSRTVDTRFHENAMAYAPRPPSAHAPSGGAPRVDHPEEVAEKILEAVQSGAAETFTASMQA